VTAPSHASRRQPARPPSTRRRGSVLVGALRFIGRVVRGLIAAAVLVALVAGLPWALWHYIGWPLPSHVPTWAEIHGVLLGPMTTTFLLDVLACAIWIVWVAFTLDVLRCTIEMTHDLARGGFDAARLTDFSAAGPMHALAGVLVGAVLLSVLGNRPAPAPAASLSATLGGAGHVVATASAWQHPAPAQDVIVRDVVFAAPASASGPTTVTAPAHPVSVVVLAPHNGVYDSLWRIAQRTLGDGARWPEIFDLNRGTPQSDGRLFTQPSLIFPGEEFALPADATAPAPPAPPSPDTSVPVPTLPAPTTVPPTTTPPLTATAPPTRVQPSSPAAPAPSTQWQPAANGTHSRPSVTAEPGFTWGPDLFVGLGLAAAVSAALLVARRRYRARYRPGSGDRDDLPVAPVVYQLRLAHLRAETDDEIDLDDGYDEAEDDARPRRVPPSPALVVGAPPASGTAQWRGALAPGLGVRDGREIALDLAVARGLGVVGAGTPAAIRALLVAVLTAADRPSAAVSVVVPAEDLVAVLGRAAAQASVPGRLRVVVDLAEALDLLEAETLVRAADRDRVSWPPLVLVTRPPQQHQRLQAVLDNGAPFGITGLLLGQWQPGVSCYIREDGTVSATGPGLGEALRGARMFRLGEDDTAALLTLLHQAEPEPPADEDAVTPRATRPRIVPVRPANDRPADTLVPDGAGGLGLDYIDRGGPASAAEPVSDVELEVTAASLAPADGELEILAPNRSAAPGAGLRPPAAVRPRPAASGVPEPSEVANTPAADRAPGSTPVASPAAVNGIAEGKAETAGALITITVLGALRVRWQPDSDSEREITGVLQPRTRELLVLLALHPGGTTRDTLVSALWGEDPPARPTNALHTALSRLRRDLTEATGGAVTDIASADNGHYRLDPATVDVDYWRFENAVATRRAAATDAERIAAYRDVVNSYGGPLAEGMSKIEWIEPAREAIRRDAIDAVSGLARALVEHDPQQTLDLLEVARAFDPHNELLYRDIMRLQERLGQLDAIPRTLTLLSTRLAEVNEQPTPQARGLAARLGGRRDHDPSEHPAGPGQPAARGARGRSAAS
jgi:DNA-binding SARP family transcriptional activator